MIHFHAIFLCFPTLQTSQPAHHKKASQELGGRRVRPKELAFLPTYINQVGARCVGELFEACEEDIDG